MIIKTRGENLLSLMFHRSFQKVELICFHLLHSCIELSQHKTPQVDRSEGKGLEEGWFISEPLTDLPDLPEHGGMN